MQFPLWRGSVCVTCSQFQRLAFQFCAGDHKARSRATSGDPVPDFWSTVVLSRIQRVSDSLTAFTSFSCPTQFFGLLPTIEASNQVKHDGQVYMNPCKRVKPYIWPLIGEIYQRTDREASIFFLSFVWSDILRNGPCIIRYRLTTAWRR